MRNCPSSRHRPPRLLALLAVLTACLASLPRVDAAERLPDSQAVRALFAAPTAEHASGMLWVWNDRLTEQQVRETLRDLASQGVKQPYVHPRPGLMTPYLSPEWFQLWRAAIDESKRLGLKLWIYDENSYPSGFAGGLVPEQMPAARGQGLVVTELKTPPKPQDNLVAAFRIDGAMTEDISARVQRGEAFPAGRYVQASVARANPAPWFGNRTYVNLLTPGVTEKFLAVTLDAYRREIGADLGRTVPGVFTDEPQLRPAGGFPWCDDLPQRFEQRWGYPLRDVLPSLALDVGDWRRVRHNYFQLLNELFVERWARPYFEYCARHQLEATGHYWEHEWPSCVSVPDNMTMYAWQHRPGIDTLMNDYADGPSSQFGNARAVREMTSVANQLGLARTLCESYGAAGWDLRFADMKRIGDWLQVLGTNSLVHHLSFITIRGGRKRDHPQSFSYHEPWWPDYHASADYQARLTAALTQGEQRNDVLLLEPTTSAWMYNLGRHSAAHLKTLGGDFQSLVNAFEAAQIGYDIGAEYLIAHHGAVRGGQLAIGQRDYRVVVVPQSTENLNAATLAALEKFLAAGGAVFALDAAPARIDGRVDARGPALEKHASWKKVTSPELVSALVAREAGRFEIRRAPGDAGILFHQRRRLADGELLFLVNSSPQHVSAGTVRAATRSIERWDPETGRTAPYRFAADERGVSAEFAVPPGGSLLLFLSRQPGPSAAPLPPERVIAAAGPTEVRRLDRNVLTLDFVDVTAGGETRRNLYCWEAAQFIFKQHGEPRNPWEQAVQFGDELLTKTFPDKGGFEATYRFTIEDAVPAHLSIVIERADLYTITCNGRSVAPRRGAWWLDKAFGVVDLAGAARTGENTVTIRAGALTHFHELEPAYLRGDFALRATPAGFAVVPEAPLRLGPWDSQGHPFYADGVAYRQTFQLASPKGRSVVALPRWLGSVARVQVNGRDAGVIGWPPWELDVSPHLRAGSNAIEVTVVGTLKNTLGPHHGNPPLGRAWPAAFRVGPKNGRAAGDAYSTVGYGLFEPFVLKQAAAAP